MKAKTIGAVGALVLLGGAVAMIAAPKPAPTVQKVIRAEGYVVDLSLAQQASFPGTSHVFRGTVKDVLEPRHVQVEGIEYVYTPLEVTVTKVYRGPLLPSDKVIVRAFGGTVDGVTYEADFAPSSEIMQRGVKLLVLGPEPVEVAGDGLAAMTPNGVHVLYGSRVIDATHARHPGQDESSMSESDMEALLAN